MSNMGGQDIQSFQWASPEEMQLYHYCHNIPSTVQYPETSWHYYNLNAQMPKVTPQVVLRAQPWNHPDAYATTD